MMEKPEPSISGFVKLWCTHCQIGVWRPTYWKKYECPVCHQELVVHINKKEVSDVQEKKPADTG